LLRQDHDNLTVQENGELTKAALAQQAPAADQQKQVSREHSKST